MSEEQAAEGIDESRRRYVEASEEAEVSEQESGSAGEAQTGEAIPGFKFLHSLMTATLFSDYFTHHADMSMLHMTRAERVFELKKVHPRFYNWCRNLDVITRAILWILVVSAASLTAFGIARRLLFYS